MTSNLMKHLASNFRREAEKEPRLFCLLLVKNYKYPFGHAVQQCLKPILELYRIQAIPCHKIVFSGSFEGCGYGEGRTVELGIYGLGEHKACWDKWETFKPMAAGANRATVLQTTKITLPNGEVITDCDGDIEWCNWLIGVCRLGKNHPESRIIADPHEIFVPETGPWIKVAPHEFAIKLKPDIFTASAYAIEFLAEKDKPSQAGEPKEPLPQPEQADQPNAQGYVQSPSDPSAYVSAMSILNEHCDPIIATTRRHIRKILDDNPEIRRWKPRINRMNIHLADWAKYVNKQQGNEYIPNEEQIAKGKDELFKAKHGL